MSFGALYFEGLGAGRFAQASNQLVLFPTPDPLQALTLGVEKSLSAIG
jgi:hypothetical protein